MMALARSRDVPAAASAAPWARASQPPRATPALPAKRPARRRTVPAAAAPCSGGDDGDGNDEDATNADASAQQDQAWGYHHRHEHARAWTFDDDLVGGASLPDRSGLLQLAPSSAGGAAAAAAAVSAAAAVAVDRRAWRPEDEEEQEEEPLVVLSRLPEQLSDPRAFTRGVLLVDKPAGWTAGDVVRAVRWALRGGNNRRGGGGGAGPRPPAVSHAGALDRHATGLMVLCLGGESAALLSPRCASLERVYSGSITLGVETATWDAWARDDGRGARAAAGVAAAMAAAGAAAAAAASSSSSSSSSMSPLPPPSAEVVDTMPWEHVTDEAIAAAAAALCGGGGGGGGRGSGGGGGGGDLFAAAAAVVLSGPASPPVDDGGDLGLLLPAAPRSGGKRAGRPAAWYEEHGVVPPFAPPARRVHVRELSVWRERGPVLGFRLAAGPGASPRALAHALGEALGTCAHLSSLRREALGALSGERAWPLDALLPALQAGRGRAAAARRQQHYQQRTR